MKVQLTLSTRGGSSKFPDRCISHVQQLYGVRGRMTYQKRTKTIPFLDVLLVIQEDGSLRHKVYRKPTHTDRYLHYNSFHHPSIKNSVCKKLINRAKTICEVDNIERELEHLRSVYKTTRAGKDRISVFCQSTVYWFSFT